MKLFLLVITLFYIIILQELGVRIQYFVLVCCEEAGAALYWRILLYAHLVVFQTVGIRKVKIKSLKDSTFVTANIYISSTVTVTVFIRIEAASRIVATLE